MFRIVNIQASRSLARLSLGRRAFSTTLMKLDATVFKMPAMSPTMDIGGVVAWKVKEGEDFSAGDELLDVETDKATMSVDAGDDGKLAKIIVPAGTNDVAVGAPIAFICDQSDDVATLKYPALDTAAAQPAAAAAAASKPVASEPAQTPKQSSNSVTGGKANPDQVFFPSVEFMLAREGISREDALSKITATGPSGRILKGDVLAYLGKIPAEENTRIASFIADSEKLDLSHIELASKEVEEPAKEESKEATEEKPAAESKKPVKEQTLVTGEFIISKQIPSKVLSKLIAKAVSKAETAAYATKNYTASDLIDPLFEDLIAPPRNAQRFKVNYSINVVPSKATNADEIVDDFDFEPYEEKSSKKPTSPATAINVELVCNDKVYDSKKKAEAFISRFGSYIGQIEGKFA